MDWLVSAIVQCKCYCYWNSTVAFHPITINFERVVNAGSSQRFPLSPPTQFPTTHLTAFSHELYLPGRGSIRIPAVASRERKNREFENWTDRLMTFSKSITLFYPWPPLSLTVVSLYSDVRPTLSRWTEGLPVYIPCRGRLLGAHRRLGNEQCSNPGSGLGGGAFRTFWELSGAQC